jgi:hypothetical protein
MGKEIDGQWCKPSAKTRRDEKDRKMAGSSEEFPGSTELTSKMPRE